MKDFFYAPNMHGVDWDALRLRYKPLAAAVNHRADLTYIIGELIGELSSGHTYVGGGEMPGRAEGQGRHARREARARSPRPATTGSPRSSRARTGTAGCARP